MKGHEHEHGAASAGGSANSLVGKNFAILAVDSVNGDEALLRGALTAAGGVVERVHPGRLDAELYDGLVVLGTSPTGVAEEEVVNFVGAFFTGGRPVALLGGAVRLLLDTEAVRGRTVACLGTLRAKIVAAGGRCVDDPVVADHGLVTGVSADHAEDFAARTVAEFAGAPGNPHDPRSIPTH